MIPVSLGLIFLGITSQTVYGGGHCPIGDPLPGHHCGRGGLPCPDYYFCNISPVDAYAECCPSKCPHGSPLLDTTGSPVYCGRGGNRCPDLYYCEIAPNDAYAVCCMK